MGNLFEIELHKKIGQGGMGQVWQGIHKRDRVPVAVKVITAEYARQPRYLSAFRNEVRAVARLNHPSIITVFDHGEITEEVERSTQGQFVTGSPYLVMEFVQGATLDEISSPLPWLDMRILLLYLFDALAHAHARGVIHRDLKPANVLLNDPKNFRAGIKLTDLSEPNHPGKAWTKAFSSLYRCLPARLRRVPERLEYLG